MFERINDLVTNRSFVFQSWDDRYGKGVWAGLAPAEHQLDDVRDSTSAGDSDMISAVEYISGTEWLPLVTGHDFMSALTILEQRLMTIPADLLQRGSHWSNAVSNAFEHLRDVQREHIAYGAANGQYVPLPVMLDDVLTQANK
ncbi:hypothetical protein [Massilia sp. LjRoot122]|uniref:hypothetical protein n=1 Tax=Massilia sp. LjRoot122 TaxID=3342257 RepID=UPI003ED0A87E